MAREKSSAPQRAINILQATVLVVAVLYFGQRVLLPLSVAVLLAFLLKPVVSALERRRVHRVAAVLGVILLLFGAIGTGGGLVIHQVSQLLGNAEIYKKNIQDKFSELSPPFLKKLEKTVETDAPIKGEKSEHVVPVRVVSDSPISIDTVWGMFGSIGERLADAVIVLILVIFMLLGREDLRNRMVRLSGKRLTLTTRTLDEVGTRISRYLLMNALVNGGYAIVITIGLWLIGVDYALMWGVLAGFLRFVPYLGPVIGGALACGMAVLQFPDWLHPAYVLGLFLAVELITGNVIEPLTYGHHTGLSPTALLVAAMFWTAVWGPIGLVLSVPLTVVLVVLGEFIKPLEPLYVLLGDKPPLPSYMTFYQRLLASDVEEATEIFEQERREHRAVQLFDSLLIPALVLAERDRAAEELTDAEVEFIWQTTRECLDDFDAAALLAPRPIAEVAGEPPTDRLKAHVVCVAVRDAADDLAMHMLNCVLQPRSGHFETLPSSMLASEVLALLEKNLPDAVCISAVGATGGGNARYLCKRLRQAFPDLRIIVGRWGYPGDSNKMATGLRQRGADQVVLSLDEACDLLQRITPLPARSSLTAAAG